MANQRSVSQPFRQMRGLLRAGDKFLAFLTDDELKEQLQSFWEILVTALLKRADKLPSQERATITLMIKNMGHSRTGLRPLEKSLRAFEQRAIDKHKKETGPKPRYTERDREIVRLHDQQGMSFGKIPRALQKLNPKWGKADGRLLSRDTVRKAYTRAKANSAADPA